ETRKPERSQRRGDGKSKTDLTKPAVIKPGKIADPLSAEQLKPMLTRLGLILAGAWVLFGLIAAVVTSTTAKTILIAIPAVITVLAGVLLIWALRQAKKARGVASILSNVETAEDRKAAIEKLDANFKKNDP